MMGRRELTVLLLLALPLGLAPVACSDERDRAALTDEELDRELDLAFQGDSVVTTFEDTAAEEEPAEAPRAEAPRAEPRTPDPATPRRQAPSPVRAETQPRPAPRPAPVEARPRSAGTAVGAGSMLALRMNDELSTERSQPGDGFTATLTEPVLDASGAVLIPAGATVRGRVTAVAPSTRVGQTATLQLAFEAISFGGRSYPLHATVARADVQKKTRTSAGKQAATVAVGAAAGAVLGRVIGGDRGGTIRGAAVGAAAGTAVAMGTADVDAVLPQGAGVVIRVDQPIEVTRPASS
jgi:hypothetical protein